MFLHKSGNGLFNGLCCGVGSVAHGFIVEGADGQDSDISGFCTTMTSEEEGQAFLF
ncbi:hypothetical protein DC3_15790 [Deinococcus cellulosilyticus NBRC 106333 = KACC 11606]|uniref:Uncharacterized protein n=1 Tax=Deinococcus cellulosilyticus (strain DSM 18568 / NBRC 106333 / KACC 11606 / 5516J-15) TaxID=1223518 RepID=A0A511MZB4_DEIC1|nr:hypothetical protein DC3_15790 [Deinococcus cellulosilyticus NBRC 106333 = KACC 11606]